MLKVAVPEVKMRIRLEYPRNSDKGLSAITTCVNMIIEEAGILSDKSKNSLPSIRDAR
jgi:hypothetical protein